jgi:hypothetical protein
MTEYIASNIPLWLIFSFGILWLCLCISVVNDIVRYFNRILKALEKIAGIEDKKEDKNAEKEC